jgi:GNAT superfamily N-acetyltransferase
VGGSSASAEQLRRLHEWFVAEWGTEGSFDLADSAAPRPLIAIEDDVTLGGLAFSIFQCPVAESLGLWINALYVHPNHRRKGVASQLIRAAECEAGRLGERGLYALTDIPDLYEKLGWRCIQSDSAGTVVGKKIAN